MGNKHNVDPSGIRSVATFDFAQKVASEREFGAVIPDVLDPVFSRFELEGFRFALLGSTASEIIFGVEVNGTRFTVAVASQEPIAYEWALWVDAWPGFFRRIFGLGPGPLHDSGALRALLQAIDSGLQGSADHTGVGWHKKEVLTHENLTSRADEPC